MKLLQDIGDFLDTLRWTVQWKLEDAKNAIVNLFPSKENFDDFVEEVVPVKKTTKKSGKKKSKKSKK